MCPHTILMFSFCHHLMDQQFMCAPQKLANLLFVTGSHRILVIGSCALQQFALWRQCCCQRFTKTAVRDFVIVYIEKWYHWLHCYWWMQIFCRFATGRTQKSLQTTFQLQVWGNQKLNCLFSCKATSVTNKYHIF